MEIYGRNLATHAHLAWWRSAVGVHERIAQTLETSILEQKRLEVHERDVYTDFLLLLLREAMQDGRMKHLKIVLMSATLKAPRE